MGLRVSPWPGGNQGDAAPRPAESDRRCGDGSAADRGGDPASILESQRALEWVRENVTWDNPGSRKPASQCNQTERWWRIQEALYSQTCGALHNDAVTKDFKHDRPQAETLLAMTSALLRNVPGTSA
ncbi:hypothetical protein ACH4UX_30215 [Streptomyces althioticus]|uniref:hypothetical protein n=1 Tax=Streptomyces althioticus TaxID=83380 RepID=UPI0037A200E3